MEHKRSFHKNEANTYLCNHFSRQGHEPKIKIIEKVKPKNGELLKQALLDREDFWIRTMVTAYPFGLNDKIKGYGNVSMGMV